MTHSSQFLFTKNERRRKRRAKQKIIKEDGGELWRTTRSGGSKKKKKKIHTSERNRSNRRVRRAAAHGRKKKKKRVKLEGKKKREANRNKIKQGCIRSNQKISQETRVSRRGGRGEKEREAGRNTLLDRDRINEILSSGGPLTKGIYARLVDEKVKGQRERSIVETEKKKREGLG